MAEGSGWLVDADRLRQWSAAVFERAGCPPEDALLTADSLVEADLRGVYSHGVQRVAFYVSRLEAGGTNPRPNVQVARQTAATALVDGDHGLGQVVANVAMQVALDKAAEAGTSYVTMRNANHYGAAAYWAMMALPRGMVGASATVSGANIMAPWGSRQALLGNNPIAYAIPAGTEQPIVLDMATSVVAKGKIEVAAKEGRPIPADWALDTQGRPTTDAQAAMAGLVQPVGGPKGSGLSMIYGLISAVLPGADFAGTVGDSRGKPAVQQSIGGFFQAIDIEAFRPLDEFTAEVDAAIRAFKSAERAQGVEEIFVPGEPELRSKERKLRDGIGLGDGVMRELDAVGTRLGVGDLSSQARRA